MKYRSLEVICPAALTEALARTPRDHFVIWTGHRCGLREGSLSARALGCVDEVAAPMALRTLLQRAARLEPAAGLDPNAVRAAVRMHQTARPAAYLLVQRQASGAYVAVADVPWPSGIPGRIAAGDTVIDARGRACFDRPRRAVAAAS